ncbi:hypothetical protein [Cupriavidus lacunae]|uniref:hypothetical protein n=1 Tax=Cupriavidus lacunae TaxID=2666307 RepID=UPI001ABEF0A4|nr:hypothetical protein [Cupriavidus lacunae]
MRALAGWAKRLPDAPWMALLMRTKGMAGTSGWHLLGKGGTLQSTLPPGRLQLCANDVLGFYFNNKGAMDVTVIDVTGQGQLGVAGD